MREPQACTGVGTGAPGSIIPRAGTPDTLEKGSRLASQKVKCATGSHSGDQGKLESPTSR